MKDPLLLLIRAFLKRHLVSSGPLLLALSGGNDSLALFHLLLACRRFFGFTLQVAHVDHGWRKTSGEEAKSLADMVEKLGFPFHLHTLSPQSSFADRNLEAQARKERLAFFKKLYQQHACQALLLAHHADDQAETVLKRLLEGASLFALGGLKEVTTLQEMQVWRPLLSVPKKELASWNMQKGLTPIEDETNSDPRFLRSRMRSVMIPELERQFGKNVASNLVRLGQTAQMLEAHFSSPTNTCAFPSSLGIFGFSIDLRPFLDKSLREDEIALFMQLKAFLAHKGIYLSHAAWHTLCTRISKRTSCRHIPLAQGTLWIERGILWIVEQPFPFLQVPLPLVDQVVQIGEWEWTITCHKETATFSKLEHKQNEGALWQDWWKGSVSFTLPDQEDPRGSYYLVSPQTYPIDPEVKEVWRVHKVPIFLRRSLPLLAYEGKIKGELLVGKHLRLAHSALEEIKVHIQIKKAFRNEVGGES